MTRNLLTGVAAAALIAALGIGLWSASGLDERSAPVVAADTPRLTLPEEENALPPEERAVLQAEMRRYLLENPEIIMEVIGVLEAQQAAEAQQAELQMVRASADALYEDGYSFVGGNPEGDITLVEFLDYQCGYCKRAHPEVGALLEADGNIRLVVKEFPILGPVSETASRAAMSVLEGQGEDLYKAFSDALMEFPGRLDDQQIFRVAERVGVDVDAMRDGMDSAEIDEQIAQNRALADRLEISGTPTFVLGETLIRGYLPRDQMAEAVRLTRSARGG
ncbi:DsbA family protein [Roseobacter sp. HKCCA0434]|uniref:DsbA family protein n=1 Tax=Roseobacter sp. HKCCA0434 TaxID=3079297 RepID=UPI0029059C37|nr:DsbA family protein [Roseobacter sp. HKCCA0434]